MGCDIHIVLERKEDGSAEWVGLWSSDVLKERPKIGQRDYGFFSEFGVRGRGDNIIYPRNIPKDVSRLAWLQYMRAPTDYHSASYASPEEFVNAWLRSNPNCEPDVRKNHAIYDLLGLYSDEGNDDYRIVFWFDN